MVIFGNDEENGRGKQKMKWISIGISINGKSTGRHNA